MKISALKTLVAVAILSTLAGCGGGSWDSYNGQLLGAQNRPSWRPITPYGMVYIPTGVLHVGGNDQDVNSSLVQPIKQVSIQGFYMDDTEITNNEYRQFVYWVRDSIVHVAMGHLTTNAMGDERIDWSEDIEYGSEEVKQILLDEGLMHQGNMNMWGRHEWNTGKLKFNWQWVDWKKAANVEHTSTDRDEFFMDEVTAVYPDTLVWVRDFTYSYNEPMARNYFSHPSFDDYPVVGVTWDQANAFCSWRTMFWMFYRMKIGEPLMDDFRLPTEGEWEYASRGGKKQAQYPWGGPYVRNSKGCILANFKPGRGNYPEDGGFYTVRADAYWPNDYGLYNMAGNVAEWTSTAYYEGGYSFIHDLNPDMKYNVDESEKGITTLKRKVTRGGSWKDIGYYIQTGVRHYEFSDSAKSYVGFRTVTTYLGRDPRD